MTVPAWEEAPGCYPDNALMLPGVTLHADGGGSGSTGFTLPLPWARSYVVFTTDAAGNAGVLGWRARVRVLPFADTTAYTATVTRSDPLLTGVTNPCR